LIDKPPLSRYHPDTSIAAIFPITSPVLTFKENERVLIGNDISVTVVEIRGNQIRLGIEAPAGLLVLREKLEGKAKA